MEQLQERPLRNRRVNFVMDAPTHLELERLSASSGVPQSEYIRRAIQALLKRVGEVRQTA